MFTFVTKGRVPFDKYCFLDLGKNSIENEGSIGNMGNTGNKGVEAVNNIFFFQTLYAIHASVRKISTPPPPPHKKRENGPFGETIAINMLT